MAKKPVFKNVYNVLLDTAEFLSGTYNIDDDTVPALPQPDVVEFNEERFEKFYFLIDNRHFSMSSVGGIQKELGYPDAEFNYEKFLKIIHPSHFIAAFFFELELIKKFLNGSFSLKPNDPKFISTIALKNYYGKYMLCKRVMNPISVSAKNTAITSLNEFTIINEFSNEPFKMRVKAINSSEWEKELFYDVIYSFKETKIFSASEFRIISILANQKMLVPELAKKLNISINTVKTYYKRIMQKANLLFNVDFDSIKHLVDFLRAEHLI